MEYRKRPRLEGGTSQQPPQSTSLAITTSTSATTSPTVKLLQTEIKTLRSELQHSQSIRSIERTNSDRTVARFKRQLADAHEEQMQNQELITSLREQVDKHSQVMEESRREWLERIEWYEEQWEEGGMDNGNSYNQGDEGRSQLLQERLNAALDQVRDLESSLEESEEQRLAAEERANDAESKSRMSSSNNSALVADENKEVPRDLRIKVAETERANRELKRQNESLKTRMQDLIQHKERAASSQRKVQQLEKEVQQLTHELEGGKEAQRRWIEFRDEIVQEGLVDKEHSGDASSSSNIATPPEVATAVRKFQTMKRNAKQQQDEIARITQLSESHLRRCNTLDTQLKEKSQSITKLERKVQDVESTNNRLELENRKIVAQQKIWKRESEGMRSLLDTYDQQETPQSKSPGFAKGKGNNTNSDALQLSLNSARDEIKLLSETNTKLEKTIEDLQTKSASAKVEHERVLDKFSKLRAALMEERAKAEAAEERACHAETLAGKGSYNDETTRVVHLKSNPMMDAVRNKYQTEIDSLKRRLEEAEESASQGGGAATTPAPSKDRGSFGSAGSRGDVNVQKLHSRLKEQFRNQIALFRQGVYLITGFKIDMSAGENDTQIFTVRSVYGEREDDHLLFQWNPKKKSKLDMLSTDMARLLMKSPSGVYVTDHGSWPGFMASVTLQLFDQQTVL